MPLKFNQTKCNAVKFNNTTLSVIKYNGNNVFKSGNVVFNYTLTSQNAGLNGYASGYYVKLTNMRTGATRTVGGSIGTTSVSLPAVDGDVIKIEANGYRDGDGYFNKVSPLQQGLDSEVPNFITYPLNETDIVFSASLQIKGYYDPELGRWILNYSSGTVTANYYIKIDTEGD